MEEALFCVDMKEAEASQTRGAVEDGQGHMSVESNPGKEAGHERSLELEALGFVEIGNP